MKDSSIRSFGQWVTQHQWDEVTAEQGTQNKTTAFYSSLQQAIAAHFPLKSVRIHVRDKPWISPSIKASIKSRQRAFNEQKREDWRKLRNKIQREIKTARNQFYNTKVRKLKRENPRAWFKELNVLTGSQRKEMTVRVEGADPDDHQGIADKINDTLTNITTSLPPRNLSELPAFLPARPPPMVQPWQLCQKLLEVKTTKAPGPDGISGRVLKEFAYELSTPIADILNTSLREGIVPREWKEAIVVPLPKTSPPNISHLRPVSLTSLIAKVCEGFVASWVLLDIEKNISTDQFGCLRGRSTTHCLVSLANHLYKTADKLGTCSTWVLTDYSKAFDLVDHTRAMKHLLEMGVRPELIPWLANFHSGRSQKTRYHGVLSQTKELSCGLAQGTKLGPIVFIAHTNSSTDSIQSPTWAFVDDLNLIESRLLSQTSQLQNDLNELSSWSDNNSMKLNPGKCKAIHICFSRTPPPPPPLSIHGHELEVVSVAKCLGVTFQADLGWGTHVMDITTKGSKRLYLLCRLRQFNLPVEDLVTVYTCFIRPVLEYAAPLWHPGLTNAQHKKIERIQRRATRIILGHNLSYNQACKALKLQSLYERREDLCIEFGKKLLKSTMYSHWIPHRRGEITKRVTRQTHKLDLIPTRTKRYANRPDGQQTSPIEVGGTTQAEMTGSDGPTDHSPPGVTPGDPTTHSYEDGDTFGMRLGPALKREARRAPPAPPTPRPERPPAEHMYEDGMSFGMRLGPAVNGDDLNAPPVPSTPRPGRQAGGAQQVLAGPNPLLNPQAILSQLRPNPMYNSNQAQPPAPENRTIWRQLRHRLSRPRLLICAAISSVALVTLLIVVPVLLTHLNSGPGNHDSSATITLGPNITGRAAWKSSAVLMRTGEVTPADVIKVSSCLRSLGLGLKPKLHPYNTEIRFFHS
ncbi:Hypp9703 [Branchiostoma lanceolatum]|uniref:Hypp9703 protein n=1 Tax=Branchiostoma lanceolatum TaxID=7740 RepID=A0A8S4MNY8_BRALA|nr:Hypp9703 [Branchiostoma lanceolatum]